MFPEAFLTQIKKQLGDELPLFLKAMEDKSPSSIRLNPYKIKTVPELERVPWNSYGYYQESRPKYTLDPSFHTGAYYVQEPSSMYLGYLVSSLSLPEDAVILDLCAAPGGKSTDILSVMPKNGLLVSNEVISLRSQILRENITKFGSEKVVVTNSDPAHFSTLGSIFDLIIVDAPCSGEGMFRKDPNSIKEWSEGNVHLCYQRQQRILNDIWACLKPGGFLIYSSCTYNELEDERNIIYLKEKYEAQICSLPYDPSWQLVDTGFGLKFYPHRIKGEGFFISCVQKAGELSSKGFNTKKTKFEKLIKEDYKIKAWVKDESIYDWVKFNNVIKILPKNREPLVSFLANYLKIVKAGADVCEVKGKDYMPSQDLAMFNNTDFSAFNTIELSETEALQYLRRADFAFEAQQGLNLITYEHLGLGFMKQIGTRFNNYYPNEWRIKMNA